MMETIKSWVDLGAFMTLLGTLVDALPAFAALLTIIWTGIRIYETDTVQKWVHKDAD